MDKKDVRDELKDVEDLYSFIIVLYICASSIGVVKLDSIYNKTIKSTSVNHLTKFKKLADMLLSINKNEFSQWMRLWIQEMNKSPLEGTLCAYYSLQRIDNVFPSLINSRKIVLNKGPFGKVDNYSLFVKKAQGFFDEQMYRNKIRRGRQTVEYATGSLNEKFKNFEIIKHSSFQDFNPIVKSYNINHSFENSMNISLSPISKQSWFSVRPEHTCKTFTIEYDETQIEQHNKKLIEIIEKSEENQSNIIVLPELALNEMSEEQIKNHLLNQSFSNLKLCFLGSKWGDNANECLLMSSNGSILIRQSKKAIYSYYDKDYSAYYYEDISTLNKDVYFLDVDGLGRIVYLICADYNDAALIALCWVMHADFIIISSCSNSTDNMEKTAEDLARRSAIVTVLSNSCIEIEDEDILKVYCNFIETPSIKPGKLSNIKTSCNFSCGNLKNCNCCINTSTLKNND